MVPSCFVFCLSLNHQFLPVVGSICFYSVSFHRSVAKGGNMIWHCSFSACLQLLFVMHSCACSFVVFRPRIVWISVSETLLLTRHVLIEFTSSFSIFESSIFWFAGTPIIVHMQLASTVVCAYGSDCSVETIVIHLLKRCTRGVVFSLQLEFEVVTAS